MKRELVEHAVDSLDNNEIRRLLVCPNSLSTSAAPKNNCHKLRQHEFHVK